MVTVAACLLLSGCKASPASDQADGTELTFWTFNGLHEQFYAEMVKEWNKKYPERKIKLNTVVYPYGQMHDNLSISLLAGKGVPDIADVELGRYSNFLKGSDIPLTDLTPLVDGDRDKLLKRG